MRIQKTFLILCVATVVQLAFAADYTVDGNQIVSGQARFTFLSPTLVRMEYSPNGNFVDEPTVLVRNRGNWPDLQPFVDMEDEWLVARTEALQLRWLVGEVPFSEKNLMITWHSGGESGTWRPGMKDEGNLRGTNHSLDGVGRDNLRRLRAGLLSREGWTLLEDSQRPRWAGEKQWLKPRPTYDATDRYFFAYGNDYAHLLSEYVKLCGKIPMLPRYAWGTWYSRYWAYSADELKNIIGKFRDLDIPVDILVIDVDWHKYGWEGYEWNREYFPNPENFLNWVHERGIHVTMNNHPGSPLPVEDSHYNAAAEMAELPEEKRDEPLKWDLADRQMNRAFMEAVHWPLGRIGVEFWWIDGNPPARMRGLNSTVWTAKTYYDGTERRTGKRSMVFSRYGDLAQHRYPVGFSGDTLSHWAVLNYEIRHTARAGNVAFPYWSHDIGGFHGKKLDPRLYVRWCQFGVFSPIVRLHSNHGIRVPWEYGERAQAIVRRYFQLRHRMYPYLNTCQREVYETGMPVCRPMYMDWPQREEAYQYDYQYMFGPSLLVAPIAALGDDDGTASKRIWLPPGLWWDYWTDRPYEGPRTISYRAPLDHCPMFVKAGGILPLQPDMDYLGQKKADPIEVNIWTGKSNEFTVYSDDGVSLDYKRGAYQKTNVEYSYDGKDVAVKIGPSSGDYDGAPEERSYVVNLHCVPEPESARTAAGGDEAVVPIVPAGKEARDRPYISYRGMKKQARIHAGAVGAGEVVTFNLKLPWSVRRQKLLAELTTIAGCARRAMSTAKKRNVDAAVVRRLKKLADVASIDREKQADSAALKAKKAKVSEAVAGVWTFAAENIERQMARKQVLSQLVGISSSSRLQKADKSGRQRVVVTVSTMFPIEGMTMSAKPVVADGWTVVGEAKMETAAFETDGFGSVSYVAALDGDMARPPVGEIALGADTTVSIAGTGIDLHPRARIDASFVQQWHLIGPFSNADREGLEAEYPPEKGIDLSASYDGVDGKANWQTTAWSLPDPANPAAFIDLEPRFSPNEKVVAYAAAYVTSNKQRNATLSIGTDDGCKVWLNGERVLYHPEPRAPQPGQDHIDVMLKKGVNTIMYKVANWHHQWGLYLQLIGRDGEPIEGLRNPLVAE